MSAGTRSCFQNRYYESWKNAYRKPDTPTHKDEKFPDKLEDYKGKPLKTRTVSADRQRTEGQDNMPFVLHSFDVITIEYWNLA